MFSEALQFSLELAIGSDNFRIPGGDVLGCSLDMRHYGFEGTVRFRVHCEKTPDPLLARFTTQDLIEATLSVKGVFNQPDPAPEPLAVKGFVTRKSVRELNFEELIGNPVLFRHYEINFQDAAQVLWRQHFPTALYADTTIEDVLGAHLAEGISLDTDWDELSSDVRMACLGLGGEQNEASFYDFLMWYVDTRGGFWSYDYEDKKYGLTAGRPVNGGSTAFLDPGEVEGMEVRIPETIRHSARVLNSYAEAPGTEPVAQAQAVDGTFRDILLRSPMASSVDSQKGVEKARLEVLAPRVKVHFSQFPTIHLQPGAKVRLKKDRWSAKLYPVEKDYCASRVILDAKALGEGSEKDKGAAFTGYETTMSATLDPTDSPAPVPEYGLPFYPVFVEGKILCELGQAGDRTYTVYSDEKTSRDFYKVNVLLWNKEIMVPFEPGYVTGHLYAPAYRDSRVLLALYFDHAEIRRFLDWGEDVRLPADGQGNQILFGKNKTSCTSVKHAYEDNKPVLTIERVLGTDTGMIKLEEGILTIETKVDSTLTSVPETYDLTPKVAAARAKLSMAVQGAISDVSGSFKATKAEVNGKLDAAVSGTKGQLDAMDEEISAKVDEIQAGVEGAMQQLSKKTGEMKSSAEALKAELKANIEL